MKKIFLTSNLNHYHKIANKKIANEINNTNGLVGQLKRLLIDLTQLYISLLTQVILRKLLNIRIYCLKL